MANDDNMTGAELQTLREACGLTRDELGALAGVAARTVKHWENGRAGVPADVAGLVQRLDDTIQRAADQGADVIGTATQDQHGAAPNEVILIRYRTPEDLARYRPDMAGLPASVHGAIIGRLCSAMRANGLQRARVVWMNPDDYEAWRAALRMTDGDATRAAWAAEQIPAQAIPHRADQPPG